MEVDLLEGWGGAEPRAALPSSHPGTWASRNGQRRGSGHFAMPGKHNSSSDPGVCGGEGVLRHPEMEISDWVGWRSLLPSGSGRKREAP